MNTVSRWVRRHCAFGAREELGASTDIARAAERGTDRHEIDRPADELPNSATLLRRMMMALGIEPDAPTLLDHAAMSELRRLCASCDHKPECVRDLAAGTATENFYAYCPNAKALDSIYVEMTFNRL